MDLAEAFRNYKGKIVDRWVDYTLSTYKSSSFFKKEGDLFANPVGGNIREALKKLLPLFIRGAAVEEMAPSLEQFMKIRSIQDFSPSQAVAPLNAVKHITREILAADKERCHLVSELYDFDFSVDLAVLAAFDLYMQCRERLYQTRIREIKTGTHILTDSRCPSADLKGKQIQEIIPKVESI